MATKSNVDVNLFDINIFVRSVGAGEHNGIKFALAYLIHQGAHIMSAISDFAAAQSAFNVRMSTAVDGIVSDIAGLNELIQKLQNTPGPISAEYQATLDQLVAAGEAATAKAEAADALTPPVVPSVPA